MSVTVLCMSVTGPLEKTPPPSELPLVLFPLTVLWVSVIPLPAEIPPPGEVLRPDVLFPLTVLWVSVSAPLEEIPPPAENQSAVLFPLTVLWVSVSEPSE